MVRATFSQHGGLFSAEEFGLVGVNDVRIVHGAGGPLLFAATRGDGWLSAYDIGGADGQTSLAQQWQLGSHLLQLETTDLVLRNTGSGQELFMAGLKDASLVGVKLDNNNSGPAIDGSVAYSASGRNLSTFSEMELIGDGSSGLAALRGGGLVNVSFGGGSSMSVTDIHQGSAMQGERANGIETAQHNGQTFAFVTYQSEDTISMFRQGTDGKMQHVADASAGDGFWVDKPGAVTVTSSADGQLYVVAAGAGSDSLTTFQVQGNGLVPVDHQIDSRDTRFADASHVTNVKVGDHNFILAAGSDSGVSLFTVLPGGRMQHVGAMPGSMETPLRGITSMDAMATPDGIRLWVSTETAPYVSEFSVDMPQLGLNLGALASGGTLNGSGGDDIIGGASGADQLFGGAGDDILLDGASADTMRGDAGRDTFVLSEDGAKDVIQDFQLGHDKIDLTDYSQTSGLGSMTITSRSWGAEFKIGTEVLEVRSADGSSLSAQDFTGENLITGNRIQTDPALYPGGTGPVRADPNQGRVDNAAGVDPGVVKPVWIEAPEFDIGSGAGDMMGTADGDMMIASNANDRVFSGTGNDTVQTVGGADRVDAQSGDDLVNGGADDDLLLGSGGFDTLNGGGDNDTLVGGGHADSLSGGSGHDVMLGGEGFDRIYGGTGNDSAWAGDSADRVFGGAGDDWLSGGKNVGFSVDGIFGEEGNDTLFGNAGFDLLNGGTGDDLLDGGHQSDNLYGEDGNDTLFGDQGFDRLFGGTGNDLLDGGDAGDGLFGQEGNDTMLGGEGGDRFFGGQGNDLVEGGTGNDTIYGGAGFDTVVGGEDDDLLYGSFNADEFVFGENHGNDTIADFDALSDNEDIDFSHLSSFTRFSDVMGSAVQEGNDVVIDTGGGNSIRLSNVNLTDLDSEDFVF